MEPEPGSEACTSRVALGDRRRARLFYGPEFCESLLPTERVLLAAYRSSAETYGGFTFVTPPASDAALAKLRGHFAILAEQDRPVEVVVNDWGVLRLLGETSNRLKPVLGRLMNKMLRDPRITPRIGAEALLPEAALVTRQSALTSPSYNALLRSHGIEMIELDNLYQGIEIDFVGLGLRPSVHVPFGFVASGPACFFAGMHQPKEKKFANDTACRLECQTYIGQMTDSAAAARGAPLVTQGNTVFYRQYEAMVEQALAWAESHHARIVMRETPFGDAYATDDVAVARSWMTGRHE